METQAQDARGETEQVRKAYSELEKRYDVDTVALQHEVNSLKKRLVEQRKTLDELQDSHKTVSQMHKDMLASTEMLGQDLQAERKKNTELSARLKAEQSKHETNTELQIIIDDLQREKRLLQDELEQMLESKFATSKDEEYQLQISNLKNRMSELQNMSTNYLQEKVSLHSTIEELQDRLNHEIRERKLSDTQRYELQHQLEELQNKFKIYESISASDLEDAMALLKLKREAGLTLEILANVGSYTEVSPLIQDRKRLQELRQQYAECVQDLDKTTRLLKLQETINAGYKDEIKQLNEKIKLLQNEYEFRLEEYSRLADVRGHRIDVLERQLKDLSVEAVAEPKKVLNTKNRNLLPGQNLIVVHIQGAIITNEAFQKLSEPGETSESFCTFLTIDLFDFDTQVSSIGLGLKPVYGDVCQYVLTIDDFVLNYLQNNSIPISLYSCNGLAYKQVGYSVANFEEIVSKDAKSFHYITDILAMDKQVIGKLEYKIEIQVSMPLAIQAYHERTAALNLQTRANPQNHQNTAVSSPNNMTFYLKSGLFVNRLKTGSPSIYGIVRWEPLWRDVVIPAFNDGYNPTIGFTYTLPLRMTQDLDRQLRTGKLLFVFADEHVDGHCYGYVKVPLKELALGRRILGDFDVTDSSGITCGSVLLEVFWEHPYKIDEHKMVSLMDKEEIAREIKENQVKRPETVEINTISRISKGERAEGAQVAGHTEPEASIKKSTSVESIESLSSSEAEQDAKPNETDAKHATESEPATPFSITVKTLTLHQSNADVAQILKNTKQLFVGYDFLGLPPEELESRSIVLNGNDKLAVDFTKEFTLEQLRQHKPKLSQMIDADTLQSYIIFNIVHEPPQETAEQEECVDLGIAKVNLYEVLHSEKSMIEMDVWTLDKSRRLGVLELRISGMNVLQKV